MHSKGNAGSPNSTLDDHYEQYKSDARITQSPSTYHRLQAKGHAGKKNPMSADCYVDAKSYTGSPCRTMNERCAQDTINVGNLMQSGLSGVHKPWSMLTIDYLCLFDAAAFHWMTFLSWISHSLKDTSYRYTTPMHSVDAQTPWPICLQLGQFFLPLVDVTYSIGTSDGLCWLSLGGSSLVMCTTTTDVGNPQQKWKISNWLIKYEKYKNTAKKIKNTYSNFIFKSLKSFLFFIFVL